MSATEKLLSDLVDLTAASKEFIGEFVYAPFGIQSSEQLNSFTLYIALGLMVVGLYRLARPAPHPRYRRDRIEYDFGRNH